MSDHSPTEPAPEPGEDGRWMSYRELAAIRGISAEHAKKLAIKQGWPRVLGDRGANRVLIPRDWLKPRRRPGGGRTTPRGRPVARWDAGADAPLAAIAELRANLMARMDQLEASVADLRDAEDRLSGLLQQVRRLRQSLTAPSTPP